MTNIGLISIIMAAFNAEKTIEMAIHSVLRQTYTNFELLVINDCSEDQTEAIVKQYTDPRIRLINNSKNSGVSYSRKRGLEEARGAWIAILDSDDAWLPEKLEIQAKTQKEKNADLLFTGSSFMNSLGEPMDWHLHVPQTLDYKTLLKQNLISNSSALVRKELYSSNYTIGDQMHEDFAIWLKITKSGIQAIGIDEPLLIYRLSDSSKSANKLKAAIMNWNTYRSIGLSRIQSLYYEFWYMINGVMKYKNLR